MCPFLSVHFDWSLPDYDDFFKRRKYKVPEDLPDEDGSMNSFDNDQVIRHQHKVVVREDGNEVAFKAGVEVQVEI